MRSSSSPNAISGAPGLTRALGLIDCILLVVGAIIGSGIFLTPSGIARLTGSVSGVLLVWVLGGVLTSCGALAYAELGSAYPRAGGIYVFLREAYGPLTAFLYGWCLFFVIAAGSIATLASSFAIYLRYLLPIGPVAAKLTAGPDHGPVVRELPRGPGRGARPGRIDLHQNRIIDLHRGRALRLGPRIRHARACPAGIKPGTPLELPLAGNSGPLPLVPGGRYEWRLTIDGAMREDCTLPFTVRAEAD